MKPKTMYRLNSYGPFADLSVETNKKSLINKICKHLAKYGREQQTTITTTTRTETPVIVKNKKVKTTI